MVDAEMRVQLWNDVSEDLWGLREDEAVGEHLLSLDVGFPVDEMKTLR